MQLGIIGLGKMGANMTQRLIGGTHQVVAYDLNSAAVTAAVEAGAKAAESIGDLVKQLETPRVVWVMVPAGKPTDSTIYELMHHLRAGDTIIDGGNSNYKDTIRRADQVGQDGLHYVDVGTSGGVWGLKEGYSMMVGGPEEVVAQLSPIFKTLAPGPDQGWGRVGPSGSGHFVKMIHNGIEYGMMQAFAEGFAIMKKKEEFGLNLHHIAEIWRHGSVVRSWLLDLTSNALAQDQDLSEIAPYVSDSGEGRWTLAEAIELDVAAPVIAHSLITRLRSRDSESYADRMLSAMRNQFGGHDIKPDS